MNQHKNDIKNTLKLFAEGNLADNARHLLDILGYRSERTISLEPNTAEAFIDNFDPSKTMNAGRARLDEWESVDLLFQLTGEEINLSDQAALGFEGVGIDNSIYQSYLFFALKLRGGSYSRTKLSEITRDINKLTSMPAMVIFRHGRWLTFAVIDRRLHRRDESRDVLEKVTLIKDINLEKPHRAHIDILFDLSHRQRQFSSFNALHEAWKEALDTEALNRDFYKELFKWFEWAVCEAKFPAEEAKTLSPEEHVIRLITRLLFVWFLKEKGLVAEELFQEDDVRDLLKVYNREEGDSYYRAVLQNLFFATLNTEIEKREFSAEANATHRDFSRYRYRSQIRDTDKLLGLFAQTPFINGGLFDCLDSEEATDDGGYRIDCFSDRHYKKLSLPNRLFFHKDDGLFPLLKHYKFTVEENTPIEQEVALDPELLGKVFENLLAAYNPETGESARKQTGSYYTPRPIVDYMVEEALVATLARQVHPTNGGEAFWEERLHYLLDYAKASDDADRWFSEGEADRIVQAISELKILDPAVGSGAFPMGVLHKLTLALRRLDPDNSRWERLQKERAAKRAEAAFDTKDDRTRREELVEIDETFKRYRDSDFGRKLYLIQNSIFGVDIQSIACQIAKLRFFISLAIEQEPDKEAENFGIKPLPNLETRFIAANTLIGLTIVRDLTSVNAQDIERQLRDNRERYFHATTRRQKLNCRRRDKVLRGRLVEELTGVGMPADEAEKIAYWDPYDQNASTDFFDTEWMFGIADGFDVIVANPPYVLGRETFGDKVKQYLSENYSAYGGKYDLYIYFTEKGISLLKKDGLLAFILPNTFLANVNARNLRRIVLENTSIGVIRTFDSKVFAAQVESIVVIVKKVDSSESNQVLIDGKKSFCIPQSFFAENADFRFNVNIDPPATELIKKVKNISVSLGRISDICIGIQLGGSSGGDSKKNFISSIREDETYKKVLDGKDINTYQKNWEGFYVKYGNWLHRKRNEKYFLNPKIIIRQIGSSPVATHDGEQYYTLNTIYNLISSDDRYSLKYVLGIMNSKLGKWFWIKNNSDFKTLFPKIKKTEIEAIPIYKLNFNNSNDRTKHEQIVALVDRILFMKQATPDANITALEKEIDRVVYSLYDLAREEIEIVEGVGE